MTGELIILEFRQRKLIQILNTDFAPIQKVNVYPAKFWVTPQNKLRLALQNIKAEMEERVPQLNAMQEGDRRRKSTLVHYGFRLPFKFPEFQERIGQTIYVSATPRTI